MLPGRFSTVVLPLLSPLLAVGCCAIGDPSCDVTREIHGSQFGREIGYCPETAIEGLPCEEWFCQPVGWLAECTPALQCGTRYSPPANSQFSVYALPNIPPLPARPTGSPGFAPIDLDESGNSQPNIPQN